ncbi:MAG: UDP-N-acetylglucosamine--N-acetylmuramyl-(pentapeptide) pyrophosphoryl-undecaprenol N-acetylglucosamine transferase, partial [Candidatus Aegiribacteria sp.]|nr:UDP-N-acetylglucosamine--N-acetylmuramyl-(pentapeptide) pyrophosphoryl-undecaprenol N-acetylglucosamine transferase [Candidatus Aegiribacteria sp.]MBD3295141.1 UDP-N-acetylglucosamine--N-acetylmuramyl-(pentapeptide) pyrophosphoryl-undecaprenol N-acetylglucosamine transferase [Candidatus Fermentibacteria bacterium]
MRIAIVGGGTGGHISPAIAVAQAVWEREPGADVQFMCTPRPVDRRMYAPYNERLHVTNPPRIDKGLAGIALLPFRAVGALLRSRALLSKLRPDVLFATGGYPS